MTETYSRLHKTLHWATVALFVVQLLTYPAIARTHVGHEGMKIDPWDLRIHKLHMISGGVIYVFALVRLWLRWRHPVARPESTPLWMWRMASAVHISIYVMLLLLPISGFLKSYIVSAAGPVHVALTRVLYALLAVHVAGALWHAIVLRDGLAERMGLRLPFQKQ